MEKLDEKTRFIAFINRHADCLQLLYSLNYNRQKNASILFTLWASDFAFGYDPTGRFQLRPNKSEKPMMSHLLRCQGFAVPLKAGRLDFG